VAILWAVLLPEMKKQGYKSSMSRGTISLTAMLFLILCGSGVLSQIIAFSGVSNGLTEFAIGLPVPLIFIYRSALPFIGCDVLIMILVMIFPVLALWLPELMS